MIIIMTIEKNFAFSCPSQANKLTVCSVVYIQSSDGVVVVETMKVVGR